jgi:hypothetical protein
MGIASFLLGEANPFSQWVGENQNFLGAIGGGLGQGQNIQGGLAAGLAQLPQAKALDRADAEKRKADKLAETQLSLTDNWMKSNYPQYAHLPPEQGFKLAMVAEQEKISGGGQSGLINVGDGTVYNPNTNEWLTNPNAPKGGGGVYDGTGMDAQNWNILLGGDPATPEYEAAWAQITAPKMTLKETADGVVPVYETPNIPASIRRPASMAPAAPPAPSQPAAPPAPSQPAAPTQRTGGWGAPAPSFGGGGMPPAAPMAAPSGPSVGAPLPGTKARPTEAAIRNASIGRVLASEVPKVGNNFKALTDPKGQILSQFGALGNPWQSSEYQVAADGLKSSISQVLYSLSGATANPGEVLNQIEVLSPKFGDKPATIAAKLDRFKTLVQSVAAASNDPEVKKMVDDAIAALGLEGGGANNDPLGLRN